MKLVGLCSADMQVKNAIPFVARHLFTQNRTYYSRVINPEAISKVCQTYQSFQVLENLNKRLSIQASFLSKELSLVAIYSRVKQAQKVSCSRLTRAKRIKF